MVVNELVSKGVNSTASCFKSELVCVSVCLVKVFHAETICSLWLSRCVTWTQGSWWWKMLCHMHDYYPFDRRERLLLCDPWTNVQRAQVLCVKPQRKGLLMCCYMFARCWRLLSAVCYNKLPGVSMQGECIGTSLNIWFNIHYSE